MTNLNIGRTTSPRISIDESLPLVDGMASDRNIQIQSMSRNKTEIIHAINELKWSTVTELNACFSYRVNGRG